MEVITEADIFFSTHPYVLVSKYSVEQLENWFSPSARNVNNAKEYKEQLINDIWEKYRRIDLIKWDPVPDAAFFDYYSQKFTSLKQFEDNFNNYSIMSLYRLRDHLKTAHSRWGDTKESKPFLLIIDRIDAKLRKMQSGYIVDTDF